MNSPTQGDPKKFLVLTDSGETGPFSPATLNRMFSKGEIQGTQMCRREDQTETHRLDEVFRHMGPSQAVVENARKKVAAYNVESGSGSMRVGAIMFIGSLWRMFMIKFINVWAIGFMIVGVSLILNGLAQRRRGKAAQTALSSKPANKPVASSVFPEASGNDV